VAIEISVWLGCSVSVAFCLMSRLVAQLQSD
jgi:hypothetical protein